MERLRASPPPHRAAPAGGSRAFRADINGMRAIAVAGVVAFHFKLGVLRAGGFAGVDVFFVISGFLMTQIILGRLDRAAFSLLGFYGARVRRIVPAFVVLILAVLVLGLVLLNPLQMRVLAQRAASALVFVSNVAFAREGTYFNAPDRNWLLHTWTLSVEWQFYMIFPVLLLVLHKLTGRRWLEPAALTLAAIVSFAAMLRAVGAGGDAGTWSFYMLWTRAWEFLAGGLCVYALPHVVLAKLWRVALHYAGLAAILITMAAVHLPAPWPSLVTAAPVLGAVAMLLARHESPLWARIAPVRLIGLWSYSIYLWHWPVAALSSSTGFFAFGWRAAGAAGSLVLGWASYVLVERRLTDALWRRPRRVWATAAATSAAVAGFMAFVLATNGLEALRYGTNPALLAHLRAFRAVQGDFMNKNYCRAYTHPAPLLSECRFGNLTSDDVLVVGDSFAGEIIPRYANIPADAPYGIAVLEHSACMPVTETTYLGELDGGCDAWTAAMAQYVTASRFKRIVFISFWPTYSQGLICLKTEPNCGLDLDAAGFEAALDRTYARMARFWAALKAQGKEVVVYGLVPFPTDDQDPLSLYNRIAAGDPLQTLDRSRTEFRQRYAAITRRLTEGAAAAGVTLVDPTLALCPNDRCPIVRDGVPLYADDAHFRASLMHEPRFAIYDRWVLPTSAQTRAPRVSLEME